MPANLLSMGYLGAISLGASKLFPSFVEKIFIEGRVLNLSHQNLLAPESCLSNLNFKDKNLSSQNVLITIKAIVFKVYDRQLFGLQTCILNKKPFSKL